VHYWRKLWNKLANSSLNRQILGAFVTVSFWTLIIKISSLLKELIIIWRFGISDELDAFLIALIVPYLFINLIAGAINPTLIPIYIKVRETEGDKAVKKFLGSVMTVCLLALIVTTLIVIFFAPVYLPNIGRGFSPEKLDLTFRLLCSISPVILLTSMQLIWAAVLNANEQFTVPTIVGLITPVITLVILLTVHSLGVFALSMGLLLGSTLEMVSLGIALKRQDLFPVPHWHGFDMHLRQALNQYFPIMAGTLLSYSSTLVDQAMATILPPGSVAELSYAGKVVAIPLELCAFALGTVVTPYFSNLVFAGDWLIIKQIMRRYLKLIFIITVPLAISIILLSKPLLQFFLQRGAFTFANTQSLSEIATCYAIEIPFFVSIVLMIRLISSMQRNRVLFLLSFFGLVSNICLNYLFMQWLGLRGIALSTSVTYILIFCFLLIFLEFYAYNNEKCSLDDV
jgi:putative peptidoglycan lipid II flippase